MKNIGLINIEDYNYKLPDDKIAKFPLEKRDMSKLLYKPGYKIEERRFVDLPELLPENSLLLFNETKVVNARLVFKKSTGASVEIFCLEPVEPEVDIQLAYQCSSPVTWKCLVGNAKRWKSGILEKEFEIDNRKVILFAEKLKKLSEGYLIKFSWSENKITFSEIISHSGMIPIPPYLKREAVEVDKTRYQTIYAENEGSVAAPTAGLHFTEDIISRLKSKNIKTDQVTLHVGAGTFKPVVSENIANHEMHAEKIVVGLSTLEQLYDNISENIIPVGTTSMRTLESLYWIALKLKSGDTGFVVDQWDPYEIESEGFTSADALLLLINYMRSNDLTEIKGETRLMIAPGYEFKFVSGLITNFHQPRSTLLLLVSAMIGESWRDVYNYALSHNFRFLSYGDSCLFLK